MLRGLDIKGGVEMKLSGLLLNGKGGHSTAVSRHFDLMCHADTSGR